jgi:GT2 family glycosyltransferase
VPDLSVVIPSWNGCSLLLECLPRVFQALRTAGLSGEVIVVDDGSSDRTGELLPLRHPRVRLHRLREHQGFQSACNHGVERSQAPLVVLLNNDALPAAEALVPLSEHFRDPELFALRMGVRASEDDTTVLQHLAFGAHFRRGVVSTTTASFYPAPPPSFEAFYADGGSSVFSREKFMELGGFDPLYAPAYQEDVDLGLRAWMRGWTIRYEPGSVVVHPRGSTTGRMFDPAAVQRLAARNKTLLVWKNIHSPSLLLNHAAWLSARAVLSWLRRDGIWWPALAGARRRWAATMRARAQVRAQRRYRDTQVLNRFRELRG